MRIDFQLPFRPDAWPRTPICPQRWHWKIVLSFPWKRPGAHINELELRAPCSHCSEVWPDPVARLECVSPCLWTV